MPGVRVLAGPVFTGLGLVSESISGVRVLAGPVFTGLGLDSESFSESSDPSEREDSDSDALLDNGELSRLAMIWSNFGQLRPTPAWSCKDARPVGEPT